MKKEWFESEIKLKKGSSFLIVTKIISVFMLITIILMVADILDPTIDIVVSNLFLSLLISLLLIQIYNYLCYRRIFTEKKEMISLIPVFLLFLAIFDLLILQIGLTIKLINCIPFGENDVYICISVLSMVLILVMGSTFLSLRAFSNRRALSRSPRIFKIADHSFIVIGIGFACIVIVGVIGALIDSSSSFMSSAELNSMDLISLAWDWGAFIRSMLILIDTIVIIVILEIRFDVIFKFDNEYITPVYLMEDQSWRWKIWVVLGSVIIISIIIAGATFLL